MNDPRLHSQAPGRFDRKPLFIVGAVAAALCGVIAVTSGGGDGDSTAAAAGNSAASVVSAESVVSSVAADAAGAAGAVVVPAGEAAAAAATTLPAASTVTDAVTGDVVADLDGSDLTAADSCLMTVLSVRPGDSGESVSCLQKALGEQGFYPGAITGSFDQATFAAVEQMQTDRNLFVDGIVGRESAISLGIWPDEESFVVRTPKPPAGAMDLLGYPLSSVASAGSDAPPLPENSGEGRRLVYDRAGQRVWAVGNDGSIIRSWLVSGSKYSNELPGTHEVYSRSEMSTAWNGKAYLPHMVRWLKTDIGAIGFHAIPIHVNDGTAYQTDAELGTRLSGGCQRQANLDADFVWAWADIGTKVVVV
jgi:peptidoglycan hydrolase-like protein with peptidoglycan-binding domain